MQIIIVSPNSAVHKQWQLSPVNLLSIGLLAAAVLITSSLSIYRWTAGEPSQAAEYALTIPNSALGSASDAQQQEVQEYYAKRLGILQAEAIRLKSLTKKLAEMAGLNTESYTLDAEPGQGGIDSTGLAITAGEFEFHATEVTDVFSQQSEQLIQLQDYLITESSIQSAIPQGKPINEGWMSSPYGYRIDPFNGRKVFHHGLDFAGKANSSIYAVADGIVNWTGRRSGYGNLVEIEHGNGYITRYAHNNKIQVNVGDIVTKGQVIALMGSTGRSTGAHVHFEVLRDGKAVNPYSFVKQ